MSNPWYDEVRKPVRKMNLGLTFSDNGCLNGKCRQNDFGRSRVSPEVGKHEISKFDFLEDQLGGAIFRSFGTQ